MPRPRRVLGLVYAWLDVLAGATVRGPGQRQGLGGVLQVPGLAGRCCIGGTRRVIAADSGRKTWDVWLDVNTEEGRLQRSAD